eukprot:506216-Pelagomonas_calceolata.AAC.1
MSTTGFGLQPGNLAAQLPCPAAIHLNHNTRHALCLKEASEGEGALGARRWIPGKGESGRLKARLTTRPILISSVSFPLLG